MDLPIPGKSRSNFHDHSAERSAISNEILTLKTRLNTLSHINQLPNEILALTLITSSQDHYHSATGHRDKSTFIGPEWIKLAHVCRHWRDVALNAPRFWSHLYVRKPDSFCALLPLSKSSPLHIDLTVPSITSKETDLWDSATQLLGQQSHRLRELRYIATRRQVSILAENLGDPMRLLEKLVLSRSNDKGLRRDASEPLHFLPATGYAPRLLHLEIHQLPIAWADPVFCPTLTTLVVVGNESSRKSRTPTGTFEQFLDALEAMAPSLVHLTLERCTSQFQSAASQTPSSTRSLTFPRLERLQIKSTTDSCIFLLEHLSVNSAARLTVKAFGVVGISRLIEILSAHVSRTTPLSKLAITFPYPTSQSVHIMGHSTSVTNSRFLHCPFDLTLTSSPRALINPLTAMLKVAKALFSSVLTLSVWSEDTLPMDIDWQGLFARTPSVRVLDIGGDPGNGLLVALSFEVQLKKEGSGEWLRSVPLCRLRELTLYGACSRQTLLRLGCRPYTFFVRLLDCAMFRCDYQAPLYKLGLLECDDVTAEDVDRLREVVVDVEWDGRNRESTDEDSNEDNSDIEDGSDSESDSDSDFY